MLETMDAYINRISAMRVVKLRTSRDYNIGLRKRLFIVPRPVSARAATYNVIANKFILVRIIQMEGMGKYNRAINGSFVGS